jgi:hypothetical protein
MAVLTMKNPSRWWTDSAYARPQNHCEAAVLAVPRTFVDSKNLAKSKNALTWCRQHLLASVVTALAPLTAMMILNLQTYQFLHLLELEDTDHYLTRVCPHLLYQADLILMEVTAYFHPPM